MTLLELAQQYRDRVSNKINSIKTAMRYDKEYADGDVVIDLAHWEGILRLAEQIVIRNKEN